MLATVFVALLLLGLWALFQGFKPRTRRQASVDPHTLTALAQPYRGLLAEALEIERDVYRQVREAPPSLRRRFEEVAERITRLIAAALPQARQGTVLSGYLIRLSRDEPQYEETREAATAIQKELEDFVVGLRSLRAKVYSVLTSAAQIGPGGAFRDGLEDTIFELEALESAFKEMKHEGI